MLRKCTFEDLTPRAEPADYVEDLARRVVEHLGDRTLAEIKPVIGALVHRHEALQPLDGAEDARDTAIAGRGVGIVRMARKTHLGGGRHRHDGAEKMIDPLPVLFLRKDTGLAGRRLLVGAAPAKSRVARATSSLLPLGARDTNDAEIVFRRGNARRGEPFNQAADAVDLALALGLLAQQDVRALDLLDRPRRQWQLHHVEQETERFDVLLLAAQIVEAPIMRIARRVDTDMPDSELRPDPVIAIVPWPDLCADIHDHSSFAAMIPPRRERCVFSR
jgi:hypothetical protein